MWVKFYITLSLKIWHSALPQADFKPSLGGRGEIISKDIGKDKNHERI